MKILIVDHESVARNLVRRSLVVSDQCLHHVTQARSVTQGSSIISEVHFDVILLDYRMPEVGSVEMVIEVRSKPNLGNSFLPPSLCSVPHKTLV